MRKLMEKNLHQDEHFFEGSKRSVHQRMNIIFDVIFEMPVTSSMCANDVSKAMPIQRYGYCREI